MCIFLGDYMKRCKIIFGDLLCVLLTKSCKCNMVVIAVSRAGEALPEQSVLSRCACRTS